MTDIVERLKIQIMHAEYDGSYALKQHAVLLREAKAEIERLERNLHNRDDFILNEGLWDKFLDWLRTKDDRA